jgi:hypothetical protein
MIRIEDIIDRARPPHHADRTGFCQACALIWPCPDTRATLRALQEAADRAEELHRLRAS